MKILFISDIHANFKALSALEQEIKLADSVVCLGDILGYFCEVNEVVDFLRHFDVKCIAGNHDKYVIAGFSNSKKVLNDAVIFGVEYAQNNITNDNLKWIKQLSFNKDFFYDSLEIKCFHGSPWDFSEGYVYSDSSLLANFDELQGDVFALGHTHRAFRKLSKGSKLILNPGSVGQSRDYEGKVCAMWFDTLTHKSQMIMKNYNYIQAIEDALSKGAGEFIYKHFHSVL